MNKRASQVPQLDFERLRGAIRQEYAEVALKPGQGFHVILVMRSNRTVYESILLHTTNAYAGMNVDVHFERLSRDVNAGSS